MWLIVPIIALAIGAYSTRKTISWPTWLKSSGALLNIHSPMAAQAPAKSATMASAPSVAAKVVATSPALTPAMALHDYLKKNGSAASDALASLVIAFQAANNADHDANSLAGPLLSGGAYDEATSAALTIYTHDPIAASAGAPKPAVSDPTNLSTPGSASMSGFNLYTYLKKKGNDKSPTLHTFVLQFQTDVNTDPKFAGPANKTGAPTLVKAPLSTTGVYDAPTATALAVMTSDRVNP